MTRIVVAEPQLNGIYHAGFNAAMLHAVQLAFPGAELLFVARREHVQNVRDRLTLHAPRSVDRMEWRTLPPADAASALPKLWENRRNLRLILGLAPRTIFCSLSRMQLVQLKLMRLGGQELGTVIHGDIDRIEHTGPQGTWDLFCSLETVLATGNRRGMRYFLLGSSIVDHMPPRLRKTMSLTSIDHPYYFEPARPAQPRPPRFAVFGNSGDGKILAKAAAQLHAVTPEIAIRLVGFVADAQAVERIAHHVEFASSELIPQVTYVERALGSSHALWLAPPGAYRLRASGAFLDALSYLTPIVFTANAYIDSYYALEPSIGIRCNTLEEVPDAVIRMAAWAPKRYLAARDAMMRLRMRFEPTTIAASLAQQLNWV